MRECRDGYDGEELFWGIWAVVPYQSEWKLFCGEPTVWPCPGKPGHIWPGLATQREPQEAPTPRARLILPQLENPLSGLTHATRALPGLRCLFWTLLQGLPAQEP